MMIVLASGSLAHAASDLIGAQVKVDRPIEETTVTTCRSRLSTCV